MRHTIVAVLAAALSFAVAAPATAQSLDRASADALAATLHLLQNPAARSAAIAGNPQAAGVDQQIQAFAGPNTAEIYALAAVIFSELATNSGGDVGLMSQALARGASDPAGFAALLSPATLQRLHELSTRITDRPR